MSKLTTAAPPTIGPRLTALFGRRWPGRYLRKRLAGLSDEDWDGLLSSQGMTRADLFTVFRGNARHRQLMARMIAHFRVDLDHATRRCWDELKRADGVCAGCVRSKRCRDWFVWDLKNDAPRIFCPNAVRFDEMVLSASDTEPT